MSARVTLERYVKVMGGYNRDVWCTTVEQESASSQTQTCSHIPMEQASCKKQIEKQNCTHKKQNRTRGTNRRRKVQTRACRCYVIVFSFGPSNWCTSARRRCSQSGCRIERLKCCSKCGGKCFENAWLGARYISRADKTPIRQNTILCGVLCCGNHSKQSAMLTAIQWPHQIIRKSNADTTCRL